MWTNKRLSELFALLSEEQYMTIECLADKMGFSERTTRKMIKEQCLVLEKHGATVRSKYGVGYRLEVEDRELFSKFISSPEPQFLPDSSEERMLFILEYLLETQDYTRMEDLGDSLYVSKKTLTADMKEVENIIRGYHLELIRKPHYGVKIKGREFDIRSCIANLPEKSITKSVLGVTCESSEQAEISECILECTARNQYSLSDVAFRNLILHLAISMERVRNGNMIAMEQVKLSDLLSEGDLELAQELARKLEKKLFIRLPEAEVAYLAIHLAGKQMIKNEGERSNLVVDDAVSAVVKEMLQSVYECFKYDFRDDLELYMSLAQHLIPLRIRLKYDLKMKNPMLNEIKENFGLPYTMAVQASTVITGYSGKILREDEIGYIALAFALALERHKSHKVKKNILLVCASGKGSAKLFAYRFREQFADYIDTISTCEASQVGAVDFTQIDYIFSTVPIYAPVPVPIQQIQFFFRDQEVRKVKKLLETEGDSNMAVYFANNLFLTDIDLSDKNEVIRHICTHIGRYRILPDGFYESVLERERLAQTEFGNLVAIPHPYSAITKETFACIAILKKPILWKDRKVQVVCLVSIADQPEDLTLFYDVTARLFLNEHYVRELIRSQSYDGFMQMILAIEKDSREGNG